MDFSTYFRDGRRLPPMKYDIVRLVCNQFKAKAITFQDSDSDRNHSVDGSLKLYLHRDYANDYIGLINDNIDADGFLSLVKMYIKAAGIQFKISYSLVMQFFHQVF